MICLAPRNDADSAELHVWTQERIYPNELEQEVKHRTCKIDATARSLHALLDGNLLVHHANGELSILSGLGSEAMQIASAQLPSGELAEQTWTHHISVLDRFAASAITKNSPQYSQDALIIRICSSDPASLKPKVRRSARKSAIEVIDAAEGTTSTLLADQAGQGKVRIEALAIEGGNSVKIVQSLDITTFLGIKDARQIQDVTLFHSGRLIFSIADGRIISTCISLQAGNDPLVLEPISTITIPAMHQQSDIVRNVSLQLISASTALIILAEPVKDVATALLLHLDLASILSSSSWSTRGVETVTSHRIANSAVLVLATCRDVSSKIATNLWSLSYTISEDNHLRWALQSADLTRKWIGAPANSETVDESEKGRRQLIKEVERIVMNKRDAEAGNAIDDAFDKWHSKEASRLESIWLSSIEKEMMQKDEGSSDSDGDADVRAPVNKLVKKINGNAPLPLFPTRFVADLLKVALPAPEDGNGPQKKGCYAKLTVHHLLSSHAISHSVRNDILSSFRAVGDWDAILMTLRVVHDLPEVDIIKVLHQIIKESQSAVTSSKGKLDAFMNVFTSVALSHSQLRAALKSSLQDLDEVIIVMDSLSSWLNQTQENLLQMHKFHPNGETGGAKKKRKQNQNNKKLYIKVDKVLYLLCDLLDTYFPLFLSTESSHSHLKRLSQQINDQLTMYNQLMILQGPLAAFARLQADREREARLEEEKKRIQDADEKLMNLKKANKKAIQAKNNVIGQVGGGIGKGQLGDKSRRRQLYEENVAVGLYSLERLEM